MTEDRRLNETGTNAFSADSEAPKFYSEHDEEYAAEIAEGAPSRPYAGKGGERDGASERSHSRIWGVAALVMAILSWFVWPAILAPAGAITGVVAFIRGRRTAGAWAIGIGLIAFVLYLASL